MPSRSIWSGNLSFGMVTLPVKLYGSVDENDIHLNQLHRECGQRIKMPKWCADCETMLETSDIVKAYPMGDDYVRVEDADMAGLPIKSLKAMDVVEFVDAQGIDPRHYDKAYFLAPDKAGLKAFGLLLRAMEQTERVAVARLTMRQREHLCTIRPFQAGELRHPLFLLQTLFYPDELRDVQQFYPKLPAVSEQEQAMAVQLIQAMEKPVDLTQYKDQYQEALAQLIEDKFNGKAIAQAPAPADEPPTQDIMAGLMASIAAAGAPVEVPAKPESPAEPESMVEKLRRLGVGNPA